jgi:hypothetical protein
MSPHPDKVHTMTDYYDGPRGGVADFGGRPHVYRSMWADIHHDRPDVFELSPIDDETLALALEDWQIWRRWEAAFSRGGDTHPALPEDRQRHDELALLLAPLLEIHAPADITATADFEWQPAGTEPLGKPLRVIWTVVDRPENCITFDDETETDA